MEDKNIALIFEKPSTRTRSAFLIAANKEGGTAHTFSPSEIHLGKKEDIRDTARVLSSMFDGIQYRGHSDSLLAELAEFSSVPVWNGLTQKHHPTQALADLFTILEEFGTLEGKKICYVGDASNNTAASLCEASVMLGMEMVCLAPKEYFPSEETHNFCSKFEKKLICTSDFSEGLKNADVVYTDVWVSMGEENLKSNLEKIELLKPYYVNTEILKRTQKNSTIFMHCLPANKGKNEVSENGAEVCETVFEGKQSRVFQQAENRLHTIQAILSWSFGTCNNN